MNRDGIPDVLQQPQVGYGAPVQHGTFVSYGSTMTVTGVNINKKRHSRRVATASGWLRCSRAARNVRELRVDDDRDWS